MKKPVTIPIDQDIWREVSVIAARKGLTKQQALEDALRLYIAVNEGETK